MRKTAAVAAVLGCLFLVAQGCKKTDASSSGGGGSGGKQITIAMMPKSKGNAYFIAAQKGAEEAAKELNVKLIWDGPTDTDAAKQGEIVETWITRGVDVIAAAVENQGSLSTVLKKAKDRGIKVITYDADARPEARNFFVNQATPEGIGNALVDNAARMLGGKGEFAIITATLTASNMNDWIAAIKKRLAAKYPDMKLADIRPCDDQQDKAFQEANTLMNTHPDLKLIMAICSPAVPGAAEAVKQAKRVGQVKVLGLGLPSQNRTYIKEGVTDCIVLWKTVDLGYLTVQAAQQLKAGTLKPGDTSMKAGRLGTIQIKGDNILLGEPFTFTKENIDQFDF
jgi:rhamnose ABC transporter rhamnose-binding protein